ncbi:hypothetical protein NR640_001600 [Pseudomonas aeruginosa]|nr:hypothetical protein [Pseudomonas aeruginosa]
MSPQAAWLAGYSDPTKNPCLAGMKNIPERLVFSPLEAAENAARATRVRESEINQKGKARKLWDIEEGKGI